MEIFERIGRIEEKVSEMHRALLGNGQPGKIRQIEDDLEHLKNYRAHLEGRLRGAYWLAGLVFAAGHVALFVFIHFRTR